MLAEFYNNTVHYLTETLGPSFIFLIVAITTILSIAYLFFMGYVIAHLDKEYFIVKQIVGRKVPVNAIRSSLSQKMHKNIVRPGMHLAKILLGLCLVIAGLLMLVLPGQGIITIVIGLSLLPFPGKDKLAHRLLAKKSVRRTLNWLRIKANKAPFIFE